MDASTHPGGLVHLSESLGVTFTAIAKWVKAGRVRAKRHVSPGKHVSYVWTPESIRDAELIAALRGCAFGWDVIDECRDRLNVEYDRLGRGVAFLLVTKQGDGKGIKTEVVNAARIREAFDAGRLVACRQLGCEPLLRLKKAS
jgi:hypothetical protein